MYQVNGACIILWWGWIHDRDSIGEMEFAGIGCLSHFDLLPWHHISLGSWLQWPYSLQVYSYNSDPTLYLSVSSIIKRLILGSLGRWTNGSTRRGFSTYFGMENCYLVSHFLDEILWRDGRGDVGRDSDTDFPVERRSFPCKSRKFDSGRGCEMNANAIPILTWLGVASFLVIAGIRTAYTRGVRKFLWKSDAADIWFQMGKWQHLSYHVYKVDEIC
jgi:hypothetical protein